MFWYSKDLNSPRLFPELVREQAHPENNRTRNQLLLRICLQNFFKSKHVGRENCYAVSCMQVRTKPEN